MLNGLIVLYSVFFSNFGIAIVVFTIIIRLLMLPLTLRQQVASKRMSELQPKMQEIQKKYKDPKRRSAEQMKLYRQYGMNPLGCLWPMLIQMPIWFGLFRSVMLAVAHTPEELLNLSQLLYPWQLIQQTVPLGNRFLWLDLARPDPTGFILPILVGATMWLQQKMTPTPSIDPKQSQMNSTMLWMMPIMFAFFTMQFPSGLALYWVVSNVVGIIMQGFISGWGAFPTFSLPKLQALVKREERTLEAESQDRDEAALSSADDNPPVRAGKRKIDGKAGSKRKNSRGSRRARSRTAKRQPRGSGDRSP
jgi:YidC/Oxa1 family membrane protein insertase